MRSDMKTRGTKKRDSRAEQWWTTELRPSLQEFCSHQQPLLPFRRKLRDSQSGVMMCSTVRWQTSQMICLVLGSLPRIPHLQGIPWVNLDLTETLILSSEHPGGRELRLELKCILLWAFIKWGHFCWSLVYQYYIEARKKITLLHLMHIRRYSGMTTVH